MVDLRSEYLNREIRSEERTQGLSICIEIELVVVYLRDLN